MTNRTWVADSAFPEFESTAIPLPREDDGELVATVLRSLSTPASRHAFLYVHGYVDYFFHGHVARAVRDANMDFYAIDLRRYGRSLRAGNRPNYCTNLEQYFAEITQAIDIAIEDGHDSVVLYGHSTGGLIASLYANQGDRRARLSALVLNSPFFEFSINAAERIKMPVAVALGRVLPWLNDSRGLAPQYGQSIHTSERGEWNYDLRWKPIRGFPTYFGWVRAVKRAQKQLQHGLSIQCPVLVMHSDASGGGKTWDDSFLTRDIVLDVNDMRKYSAGLGPNVKRIEIPGAIHDIMLSRWAVRESALQHMLEWTNATIPASGSHGTPSLA